jgi:cytochrome c biogenesis protein CcmG/thiol:disulfide interchange protein DsbE
MKGTLAAAWLLLQTPGLLDEPAIEFEAHDVQGNVMRSQDLRGRVVLVNFWGIWCKSCRQEIPHLVELDRKWKEAGLVVLGADYGDATEDLEDFAAEMGMIYPVLVDEGLADDYEVLVYPTSIVIDRSGRIRYRVEGYREESFEAMTSVIEQLLDESWIPRIQFEL